MGNRPSEMMDREKAYIPELQISFMEHIAMPIYKSEQRSFLACDVCLNLLIYQDVTSFTDINLDKSQFK